jgi:hypothetical protein
MKSLIVVKEFPILTEFTISGRQRNKYEVFSIPEQDKL